MWNWQPNNWSALVILCLALWFLPWWGFIALWGFGLIFLPRFYQALAPALLFDLIYIPTGLGSWHLPLVLSVLTVIFLLLASELQYRLRL